MAKREAGNDTSQAGYAEAMALIERARRERETVLDISKRSLTLVPHELFALTKLQTLYLNGNQISQIPPEIAKLTNLETLYLFNNQITQLPQELAALTKLQNFGLSYNSITQVPPVLAALTNLQALDLSNNQITQIPPAIAALTNLQDLRLHNNRITQLPSELAVLTNLQTLGLRGNPLPDQINRILAQGTMALLAYLRDLKETVALWQAKVHLVGEGKVGKSSLVAALQGEVFVEDRPTTHGMEIKPVEVAHPAKRDIMLTLNCWDFGGQEVYRVSHQFFFSERSLYLVLWNARMGFGQCDVEGWIKRIVRRVGLAARIIVVATHCKDGRQARVDEADLHRKFPGVLQGFFHIDSEDSSTLGGLRKKLAEEAAELPGVGDEIAKSWVEASDEIESLGKKQPRMEFKEFASVCKKHGLNEDSPGPLAKLMHELGQVVYFDDQPELACEVVLNPEWLSKAISYVLEDEKTNKLNGFLDHGRVGEVWDRRKNTKIREGDEFPISAYPYFLKLMEKFDVSYRIMDKPASLVAQLVPAARPAPLPWTSEQEPPAGTLKLKKSFVMKEAPFGLVPWTIVRTHIYSTGMHWQRGVFLKHPRHGEAMVELIDNELALTVRSEYPPHYMSLVSDAIENLIRERWPGLREGEEWSECVPCPHKNGACNGRFKIRVLRERRRLGKLQTDCGVCGSDCNIDQLLHSFDPPRQDEATARLHSEVSYIAQVSRIQLQALRSEDENICPRLFTLVTEDLSKWNPANVGRIGMRLNLWCEYPDCVHPCAEIAGVNRRSDAARGEYIWKAEGEWLRRVAPFARVSASILQKLVPIAGGFAKVGLDEALLRMSGRSWT